MTRKYKKKKKRAGGDLLSHPKGTIIGAGELGFRVRDGNGHFLLAIATGTIINSFIFLGRRNPYPQVFTRGKAIWPGLTGY